MKVKATDPFSHRVDWVPVSNCSCPHLYLYVVVLELEHSFKQTNDVSKKTGEDNNKLGLEPRLAIEDIAAIS